MKKLILTGVLTAFTSVSFAQSAIDYAALDNELKAEVNSALRNTRVKTVVKRVRKTTVKIDPTLEMADEAEARAISAKQKKANVVNKSERKDEADMDRLMRESQEIKGVDYSVSDSTLDGVGASSTDYSSNRMRTFVPFKQEKKLIGLNFFSFYSGAETLGSTHNSLNNGIPSSSTILPSSLANGAFATSPSYGLGLEFAKHTLAVIGRIGLGFAVGGTYEFNREIDRGYIDKNLQLPIQTQNPQLSVGAPYFNIIGAYKNMYVLGGINFSVPQATNSADEIYKGALGFQFGAGMNVTSWITLEASYRILNMNLTPRYTNTMANMYNNSILSRQGLGIYEDESLSLNGFLINLKFRL